jgi:hypothetical protein
MNLANICAARRLPQSEQDYGADEAATNQQQQREHPRVNSLASEEFAAVAGDAKEAEGDPLSGCRGNAIPLYACRKSIPKLKPETTLAYAYISYINIRHCYDARQGYLAINISDPEMQRARLAVERIESKLKPLLPSSEAADTLWQAADIQARDMLRMTASRDFCQMHLLQLNSIADVLIPDRNQTKKDF